MDAKAEKIALFRYGLIAPLVLEPLPRGELTRRAEEIAARHYDIPASKRTSISVDTLLDWALRYRNGGFEALAPQPRQDRGQSRTIPGPPLHPAQSPAVGMAGALEAEARSGFETATASRRTERPKLAHRARRTTGG